MKLETLEVNGNMVLQTDGTKLNVDYSLFGNSFTMQQQRKLAEKYLVVSTIKSKHKFEVISK